MYYLFYFIIIENKKYIFSKIEVKWLLVFGAVIY